MDLYKSFGAFMRDWATWLPSWVYDSKRLGAKLFDQFFKEIIDGIDKATYTATYTAQLKNTNVPKFLLLKIILKFPQEIIDENN
jgi:hypothetical protein